MNKKGDLSALQVVGGVILVLALVWILLSISQGTISGFSKSLNTCSGREGVCKTSCGENEQQLFQAAGACNTGVCCTSDEIKNHLKDNRIIPGSNAIQLHVADRRKLYKAQESVPLFTGRLYTFYTYIDDDILQSGDYCEIYITDESTDQILYVKQGDGEREEAIASGDCQKIADDQARGNKSGIGLQNIRFSSSNLKQNIQVNVEVSTEQNGDRVAKASYNLDLTRPVSVVGLTSDCTQEESFKLRCNIGDCESADYRFIAPDAPCNSGYFSNGDAITTEKVFLNDEVGFYINGTTLRQRVSSSWVNNPLCMEVNMRGGETLYFATNNVMIDTAPPHSISLDGTKITCQDSGSGCEEYYYAVRDKQTEADVSGDVSLEESIMDFITRTVSQGKCPNSGYTGPTTDAEINVDGVVYANVCIYAKDKAGNENEPVFQAYVGTDEAQQGLLDQAREKLEEEMQGSN